MIIDEDLFDTVLLNPLSKYNADKLTIVSGYASASMLSQHRAELHDLGGDPMIDLTIGMTSADGIASAQHSAYLRLQQQSGQKILCSYYTGNSSVHAKVYVWSRRDHPLVAFAGSANYTHSGFRRGNRIEAMSQVSAESAYAFCRKIRRQSQLCLMESMEDVIQVHKPTTPLRSSIEVPRVGDRVRLTLLDQKTGQTPPRSGLNWGQRPGREPNQAYIPIPARIYKTGFFPPIGERFIVQTDDGETLEFVRAQQSGKALHTPDSNSRIGLYFRSRLRVKSGAFVTKSHLDQYGRTNLELTKIDEETYFLDFSV